MAMKSALELAMEKVGKIQSEEGPLTDEQRQQIGDLRKQYEAKIAEKEIMMQSEIQKLIQNRPPQEAMLGIQQLQEQFQETKKALQQEADDKVAEIRSGKA
ncbi:hypothetical protein C2W62_26440 [Candidatus Entotheonella serta]|nr:hypothetical protein C2W62_26440 [Candidatus Entotheonella serta]